jgi:sortase A
MSADATRAPGAGCPGSRPGIARARRRRSAVACAVGGALLVAGGAGVLAERAWIAGKAAVASVLVERAFRAHLDDGLPHRPWRWADTWPVARIELPRLGVSRIVLAGATGSSLAFGPGWVDGTALPGSGGTTVVAGHRDGSLAFLRHVAAGDAVVVETRSGTARYRVASAAVTAADDASVLAPRGPRLVLVTCHPFDGLLPSAERYVVTALPAAEADPYRDRLPRGRR